MIKIKDVSCEKLPCESCPFSTGDRLKICTSFKLKDTIGKGFELNKEKFGSNYAFIFEKINKEISEDLLIAHKR